MDQSDQPLVAYLGAVLEGVADGVLLFGPDGRVVRANRAFGELIGKDGERLIGTERGALLQQLAGQFAEPGGFLEATRAEAGATGPFRTEVELVRPSRRSLRWSANASQIHPRSGHVEIVTDVTAEAELRREREVLARIDPVTGLGNRRSMDEALEREVARATRSGLRLSVVDLRVDGLGGPTARVHAALRAVARVVMRALRGSDVAALWAEGEIVALLPATGAVGARSLAERVRAQVEKLPDDESQGVTVSCGVAELHDGERGRDAVQRAGARAADAQALGGNRLGHV